jgi:hypothetical protein
MCNLGCSSKVVTGTVRGIELTLQSQRRMKEYKPPGSGNGYGQLRPLESAAWRVPGHRIESAQKIEFVDKGIRASVKDRKGQAYNSVYSEVFGFTDEKTEAKIVFEIPQNTALPTLMLDDTSLDLSAVKD